jgi:hypothetical protein
MEERNQVVDINGNINKVLIGSKALNYHYPDYPIKENTDTDYAVDIPNLLSDKKNNIEFLYNPIICNMYKNNPIKIISPDDLLSLKISHMFWDINFDKHMYHIQFLLDKGHQYDLDIINELKEYWLKVHPKIRRSNLVQSKEEFFNNNVNEDTEQHDHLHTLINPIPMYTLLLKEGSEVELDESKWGNLTFEQKCDVVFEESAVMAYERYTERTHYREAYRLQVKDNIIKHFPFYIAMFAIENYKKVYQPKINYRELINNKLWN